MSISHKSWGKRDTTWQDYYTHTAGDLSTWADVALRLVAATDFLSVVVLTKLWLDEDATSEAFSLFETPPTEPEGLRLVDSSWSTCPLLSNEATSSGRARACGGGVSSAGWPMEPWQGLRLISELGVPGSLMTSSSYIRYLHVRTQA